MLMNLHISTKVFLILAPLLFATFAAVVYSSFISQEQQVLRMAQLSADSQASIIKKSLVHMMQTQEEVDDAYLRQISEPGRIENLQVMFYLDSLRLKPDFLTPERVKKLERREALVAERVSVFAGEAFTGVEPVWTMACDSSYHADLRAHAEEFRLGSLEEGIPSHFWSCARLKIIQPFIAERKCLTCHDVEVGAVLGAASMEIPIGSTVMAIQDNAIRSLWIFVILVGAVSMLGVFIFRRFVSRPVEKLVKATETFIVGNVDSHLQLGFENDEFGSLARSFDEMRLRLKNAQDRIIEKERLSTIGQMASSIIHDFRNPMTNIAFGLQMLETQRALSEEKRGTLFDTIRRSVDRMARMTQELMEFARGETHLQPGDVDLGEFARQLEASVRPALEKSGVTFTVAADDRKVCTLDGDRLQRSLINIINNAEDALAGRANGKIHVSIRCVNGEVVFAVADNGPGIPESVRGTVFEPFVTAGKTKGTGLGLAITKRVVEEHGGTVRFNSDQGTGTTFVIRIPRVVGKKG